MAQGPERKKAWNTLAQTSIVPRSPRSTLPPRDAARGDPAEGVADSTGVISTPIAADEAVLPLCSVRDLPSPVSLHPSHRCCAAEPITEHNTAVKAPG
jgi:hypothetical protein